MPPKKPSGKKGSKKKGAKKIGDQVDVFQQYLDELFFISPQAREHQRELHVARIKAVFKTFQTDRDGYVDSKELGNLVRTLGFNPTLAQIRIMLPMVSDNDAGIFVMYEKFEALMTTLMVTNELKYTVTNAEGVVENHAVLIHRDPERVIMEAFDVVWDASGRKVDPERIKYIDGEPMKELLCKNGPVGEQLDENEGEEFIRALADGDTGFIKEDVFALLSFE